MFLHNRVNSEELREKILADPTPRTTLSFYRYVILKNLPDLRNDLYRQWHALGVFGRIYIAREGINAQLSLPTENLEKFRHRCAPRLYGQHSLYVSGEPAVALRFSRGLARSQSHRIWLG